MARRSILIFGYGNHGRQIAKGLREDGYKIKIVDIDAEHIALATEEEFDAVEKLDLGSDETIASLSPQEYDKVVCVMDDEHYNVFITLSLHSLYPELYIVAISDSIHTTKKLYMAGAKKVIDMYEASAHKIHSILTKPIATKLLEDFILSKEGIAFMEMTVPEGSAFVGKHTDDVDFSKYDVILVGMVDLERRHGFEFMTTGHNHKIDAGDMLVCMGEVEKLHIFKRIVERSGRRE